MSATRRIATGSILNWVKIGVGILVQLAVTPVYLSFWSASEYGIWLTIQAVSTFFLIPGGAHQTYVGNEMLKSYAVNEAYFYRVLKSSLGIGACVGATEILIAFCLAVFLPGVLEKHFLQTEHVGNYAMSFFVIAAASSLMWSWGGIWSRSAVARGHYVTTTWLGIIEAIAIPLGPMLVIPFGAGIWGASLAMVAVTIPVHLFSILILRRKTLLDPTPEGVRFDLSTGVRCLVKSQGLSLVSFLTQLSQQGVRLILAPLAGTAGVAVFSTTRTLSGIAQRGLATITAPMMPELMRFLNRKDLARTETAFATVWFVLVLLLAPGLVVLQATVSPVFSLWTRGQIAFDPLLFATLSSGILTYAISQPMAAIVQGNNLLRAQLVISILSVVVLLGAMFFLVPRIGVVGAGAAIWLAEIISGGGLILVAHQWMRKEHIYGASRQLPLVAASAGVASASLFLSGFLPNHTLLIAVVTMPLLAAVGWFYVSSLPDIAKKRIAQLLPMKRTLS